MRGMQFGFYENLIKTVVESYSGYIEIHDKGYWENQSLNNSINEFSGKNFSTFKEKLSEVLTEKIEPISKEIKKLLNDENYLDAILLEGSVKADKIASKKIKEIKQLVGF